ncbi:unnamed protein product [Effrenium voratum]|uniref:Alcohol dehydrogenase iron-type/glycerol dehydrogenase GldA domain-containing protein n=1 Tax=Effrenium voratum TaxID=2562239 RepID=A0AA36HRS4_9DINO|nr:unnamed protein product [Effrenium voratum]
MRPLCRAGGACAERGWGRVLVLAEEGRAAAMALQSMQKAGVVAQLLLPPVGPCAWPGLVDEVAPVAARADAVLGVGGGAVLDLAKAAAAMAPLLQASDRSPSFEPLTSRFLLGAEGHSLLPGAALPVLLAPTRPTVAATSGRCLLHPEGGLSALAPLAIAGPGPFGVGVGLQALEVFQVPSDAAKQSTRGTAAAVAHALAVFVDGAAAAGGTIKQKQLLDDMMMGVGSSFSALRQPESAQVDAFEASLQAGLAASESDANAKGDLCVIHALACILAGCRNVPFGWACRVLLPPVLRAWEEEGDDPSRSLAVLAEAMLGSSSLARLADFLDGAFSAAGLPPLLPLDHAECPDSAATLLALCAEEAPVANQRPALVGPVSLLWGVKGTRLEPHKVI